MSREGGRWPISGRSSAETVISSSPLTPDRPIPYASWARTAGDLSPYIVPSDPNQRTNRIVLGWMPDADTERQRHLIAAKPSHSVLVLGAPEGGKTLSLIVPNLLEWTGGAIVTSTRPDVLAWTYDRRAELGKPVHVFDPSGALEKETNDRKYKSAGFSFLDYCATLSGAAEMADMIIRTSETGRDTGDYKAYWEAVASQLFTPILHAVKVADERHYRQKDVRTEIDLLRKVIVERDLELPIRILSERRAYAQGSIEAHTQYMHAGSPVDISDLTTSWEERLQRAQINTRIAQSVVVTIDEALAPSKKVFSEAKDRTTYEKAEQMREDLVAQSLGLENERTRLRDGALSLFGAIRVSEIVAGEEPLDTMEARIRDEVTTSKKAVDTYRRLQGKEQALNEYITTDITIEQLKDGVYDELEQATEGQRGLCTEGVIAYDVADTTVPELLSEGSDTQRHYDLYTMRRLQAVGKLEMIEEIERTIEQEDSGEAVVSVLRERRRAVRTERRSTQINIQQLYTNEGKLQAVLFYQQNNKTMSLTQMEAEVRETTGRIDTQLQTVDPSLAMLGEILSYGSTGIVSRFEESERLYNAQTGEAHLEEEQAVGGLHALTNIGERQGGSEGEINALVTSMKKVVSDYDKTIIEFADASAQLHPEDIHDANFKPNDRLRELLAESYTMIKAFLKPYDNISARDSAFSDINPREILSKGETLYIHLPASDERTYKPIVNLIMEMLLREADKQSTNAGSGDRTENDDTTTLFAFDELGSYGKIDTLPRLMATMRHLNVRSILVFQDIGQMNGLYGEEAAGSIINNSKAIVIFGSRDRRTQQVTSDLAGIGQRERPADIHRASDATTSRTTSIETGALLQPPEVRFIPDGQGIVIINNESPGVFHTRPAYEVFSQYDPARKSSRSGAIEAEVVQ